MITRSEFLSSEFIQDWCRPQGIGGGVVVTIQRDESRIMAVSSFFSAATFEREPDVTGRLQRLAPHLLRVAQLNRQFASLEARTAAAEGALERLATAMLVLNADGQVIYLNQQADRIMAAADGITIRSGKLEIYKSEESRALRGLIASAAASQSNIRSQPGGVMAITRRSGHGRYEVLAAPISDTTIRFGFSGPLVVVFIRQPDSTMTTPMEWLRQIYGLTAAEGRLMQALVAGDSLDGAASRFSVTRETVRSQLKAVFQKTGAASQGDLIRLGMRSLAATFR
jgi:DNA-binding CsgD family transcriptional regulator